jgi:hypothetical protein
MVLHPRVVYVVRTIPTRVSIWMVFPPLPRCTERLREVYVLRTPFLSAQIQTQQYTAREREHVTQHLVTDVMIHATKCGAGYCRQPYHCYH